MRSLPKGMQWNAHEKPGGRAARRRIQQMVARGVMICAVCETERPLGELVAASTDPAGAVLLDGGRELGEKNRVVCRDCIPPELRASA